ncbi:DUF3604 domain-containing protein [Halorarius litoreus]|uniref:DUF3604 domain-containing protein n=1 Tax=Halorarius litoreus TaxID=2962676 RepID=UPI0020CFB598|nr:DUF3604 domain-containing protein [Halorarius litoreus]
MPGVRDTLRVFADSRPSLRDLWASRTGTFDRTHCILPSDAVTGSSVTVTVQTWDEYERRHPFEGTLAVDATDPDATHPDAVEFTAADGGLVRGPVSFSTPGVHYLTLTHEPSGRRWVSNPVRVHDTEPAERTYWGDIHLHSQVSDGAGTMAKGFRFGRDVMALDVCAYTDHDTMGFFIPPQWQRRRMHRRYFDEMKAVTEQFHEPDEFVTLFAYEWTKQPNMGGHVNVYFDGVEDAELFDSLARETHTYEQLWQRLRAWREERGRDVLTIPHHPAEEMYPFDFSNVDYDDELAPLVEVYSQWGSSERPEREGNRRPLAMGQGEVETPGHYAQDALELGYRVGLMAGADYHGPFPGHSPIHAPPHLPSWRDWREDGLGWGHIWRLWNERSYPGGLTAFRAPELTREAVFDALRSRTVYGTTQPDRILVEFAVDGVRVGEQDSEVRLTAPDAEREISVDVHGTAPLSQVTVVKNNEPWHVVEGTDDPDAPLDTYTCSTQVTDDAPVEGMAWDDERGTDADVYYLRVEQVGRGEHVGGAAWAGPLWVVAT